MSTDIIDTQYGQICCAAVHHFPLELAAYHEHLVHQVGVDAAPSLDEIKALGAEVSMGWAMGTNPSCFLCGDDVPKGAGCHCLLDALPWRMPKAQAEALLAKGDKTTVACKFTCAQCGCMGTMTAAQLLRTGGKPYTMCRRDAKKSAMAVKAARASQNAEAQKLIAAARATAQAEIAGAERAFAGADTARRDAHLALQFAANALGIEVKYLETTAKIVKDNGGSDADVKAYTAACSVATERAREMLHKAQQRYESTTTRANAALDRLTNLRQQAGVQA